MKKTIVLVVLFTTLSVCSIQASASDAIRPYLSRGESGHFNYAVYNNRWLRATGEGAKRAAITGLSSDAKGDIVIPSSLDGYEVYGIDPRAFSSCEGIKSIAIPKTVRFLKPGTLNLCQGLERVVVDKDHPEYSSIDGVMFNKQKTELLFYGSGRKAHYAVPDTTTAIGSYAFSHCKNLKSVSIPKSVTNIGGNHGSVFLGCSNLERIDIAETVTNIGQKTFQDCSKLKEITIPTKVTAIPFGLFWRCGNLAKVTLPDGISSIGNYAFAGCTNLKLQGFPESLTTIGAYAFKDCKSLDLESTTIPKSVITMERGAFQGCGKDMDNKVDPSVP